MLPTTPLRLATGVALAAIALAACTTAPPTTSPGVSSAPTSAATQATTAAPTSTPTPSPTVDADQAAALDVVQRYSDAMAKVRANPARYDQYKMIDLLKPLAFDDMIQANLNGVRPWRDRGWHETGASVTVTATASKVDRIDGTLRVSVTTCRDQRGVVVVDKNDKPVKESEQQPDFVRRTYELRRAEKAAFKVYQSGGKEVATCES